MHLTHGRWSALRLLNLRHLLNSLLLLLHLLTRASKLLRLLCQDLVFALDLAFELLVAALEDFLSICGLGLRLNALFLRQAQLLDLLHLFLDGRLYVLVGAIDLFLQPITLLACGSGFIFEIESLCLSLIKFLLQLALLLGCFRFLLLLSLFLGIQLLLQVLNLSV